MCVCVCVCRSLFSWFCAYVYTFVCASMSLCMCMHVDVQIPTYLPTASCISKMQLYNIYIHISLPVTTSVITKYDTVHSHFIIL